MADFRKVILVLAVLAIVAAPASAQLACTAEATPAQIRAEGITELVGDTTLRCTNDVARSVSIEAIMGATNITNRVIDRPAGQAGTWINAYAFVLYEPTPGTTAVFAQTAPGATVGGAIPARLTTSQSAVWQSVMVPATVAGGSVKIILTNLRVNASALGAGTTVTPVNETVLVSGTAVLGLPNNVVTVAAARPGIFFGVEENDAEPNTPFQACLGKGDPASEQEPDFTLTFTEGFADAFKIEPVGTEDISSEENPSFRQNGVVTTGIIQGVDTPTRLRAVFRGVPAGVKVWVSTTALADSDIQATLVAGTAEDPENGYDQVDLTDGEGEAIWEVIGTPNRAAIEDALFGVIVSFSANIQLPPVTGVTAASQVGGSFAPISDVFVADDEAPIPRFVDTSDPEDVFQVVACVTNLLFPFVSNQAGFDTGIAIVNTSTSNATGSTGTPANQPFNTKSQTGTCTLYYFGVKSDGSAPPIQTTVPIGAATTSTNPVNKFYEAFALSQGGPAGATGSVASFTGYIIARCNFQFGHGFAFITDLGAQRLAQGYLALVIPDRGSNTRKPENFTTGGTGEQLAN